MSSQSANDSRRRTDAPHYPNIGLVGRFQDPNIGNDVNDVRAHLEARGRKVWIEHHTGARLNVAPERLMPLSALGAHCDLIIVIGGDGTLLAAARELVGATVDLLGINRGHLGFLVDMPPTGLNAELDRILAGQGSVKPRFLLAVQLHRHNALIAAGVALNDAVVHRAASPRMIEIHSRIDGRLVNRHRADGLVVATPTGSTAYALSTGGPLIYPTLEAIALVPICPHTLSNRPIIVDANSHLEIEVHDDQDATAQLSLDGQVQYELCMGDRLTITRHPAPLNLLHHPQYDYFHVLREKLHWASVPAA